MRKKLSLLLVALMAVSAFAVAGIWKVTSETKVAAESTYLDDDLLTVKTVYATTLGEDAVEFAGQKFTHFVKVRVNAYPSNTNMTGTEQAGNTPLLITPKKDVLVTFYYRRQPQNSTVEEGVLKSASYTLNGSKAFRIYAQGEESITEVSNNSGLAIYKEVVKEKDTPGTYDVFAYATTKIFLEKGKTYTACARGTTIQLCGIEAEEAKAAFTIDDFNFAIADLATSSGSSSVTATAPKSIDGDLNLETKITDPNSEVVLTISKSTTNTANRFWLSNEKPQLRLYGHTTLTFQAPEDIKITDMAINYSKWNGNNSFAVGSVVSNEENVVTWKGSNNKVVLNLDDNTQINSIAIKTSAPAVQAYAVFDPENQTLTFKYDKNMPDENAWLCGDTGEKIPTWNDGYTDLNTGYWKRYANYKFVVFDDSFAKARPTSCYRWFAYYNLTSIVGWANFNTSEVTDMSEMFSGANSLKSLNLANFDTKNVITMRNMFGGCQNLEELDLSAFNTEKVTDMCGMFANCEKLAKLNLSSFNTANVEDMSEMFYSCFALTKLDLSNFNTEKVENMNSMFRMDFYGFGTEDGPKLESIDLSSFNTANVTNMSSMFYNCGALKSLDLSSFNTEKVYNMYQMFYNDSTLTAIKLSSFDTKSVWNMQRMFWGCKALTELDLSNFDVSNVNDMEAMFQGCAKLAKLNIDNFDTQNVYSYYNMFNGCAELTELNLMKFDTQNGAYNMYYMFNGCAKLAKVKATNLFVNYNYDNMFTGCVKLPEFDENIVSGQDAINKYFGISKVLFNDYVKAGEYITYYKDNALKIYGEVGALYTITGVSATEVAVKELKVAAKKTPLLVLNESEEDAKIMIVEAAADEKADDVKPYAGFLGTLNGQDIAGSTEGLNYYVCNGNEFVWVMNGGWINPNRCWLVIEDADAAAAPSLNIVEGEFSLTGINSVKAADQKSAQIYDLQGRKVGNAQKGMYIMNGKKVVLK